MNQKFKQKSGIYKILNLINNKIYVGSSINISVRITSHKLNLRKNKHCNTHLQYSYNKYGIENFIYEVIEYCDENLLLKKEEYYINYFKCLDINKGYNISSFSNGRKRHSKTTIEKISNAHKGKKKVISEEWRKNISKANKGRKNSNIHKENIRKSKIGIKRNTFSEEWKTNLGNSRRKFLVSLYKNDVLIKQSISYQEAALFLNVSTQTIDQALKNNYKCKNHNLIQEYYNRHNTV